MPLLVMPSRRRRLARLVATSLVLASVLALLVGCGGGGGKRAKLAITVSGGGDQPITVKAPKSIKGGLTRITLKNKGHAPLDAQLVRVDGNQSALDVVRVVGAQGQPIPSWIHAEGGVGQVRPGKSGNVVESLPAGRYYIVPTSGGQDQRKPSAAPLRVEGGKVGKLPKTKATITAREYTFDVSRIKAGKEKVLFRNAGDELHHVVASPILPGKTIADVKKFVAADASGKRPSGPPPVNMNGGFQTTALDKGGAQIINIDLKRGRYAFMCFLNDRKGGLPHVMKGMLKEVDVK